MEPKVSVFIYTYFLKTAVPLKCWPAGLGNQGCIDCWLLEHRVGQGNQSFCLAPSCFYVCGPVWRVGTGKPLSILSFFHESRPSPVLAFGHCQPCSQASPWHQDHSSELWVGGRVTSEVSTGWSPGMVSTPTEVRLWLEGGFSEHIFISSIQLSEIFKLLNEIQTKPIFCNFFVSVCGIQVW